MDAVTLQPAAGAQGELTGILMVRAYHRARGDHGPDGRPGARLRPRDEPGDRLDGRLPDGQHPLGPRRRRGPRRLPGGPRADDGGGDDHQPLHARALRAAGRGAPRDGPRRRRPGLHGRGQPQRAPRPLPARRRRLRRHALQRPQDVLHPPRRRRAGGRPGRGPLPPGPVPARAARPARAGRLLPPGAGGGAAGLASAGCAPSPATSASSCARMPTSAPTARSACAR